MIPIKRKTRKIKVAVNVNLSRVDRQSRIADATSRPFTHEHSSTRARKDGARGHGVRRAAHAPPGGQDRDAVLAVVRVEHGQQRAGQAGPLRIPLPAHALHGPPDRAQLLPGPGPRRARRPPDAPHAPALLPPAHGSAGARETLRLHLSAR